MRVIRVTALAAIVVGAHWFYAGTTLPVQISALATFSAGLAVVVATFVRN